MLSKYSSHKMRGRNDGSERKRLVLSVCVMFVALSLLCVYYGSFFKSTLRNRRDSSPVQEDEKKLSLRLRIKVDEEEDIESNGEAAKKSDSESLEEDPTKAVDSVKAEQDEKEDEGENAFQNRQKKHEASDDMEDSVFDISIKTFPVCDSRYSELIPCLDRHLHSQLKLKLNLSLMEHYERHCPTAHRRLNCLIPAPTEYKVPIPWPASRDEVWRANVPHTFLAMEKSDQHWMIIKGDKVNFPGGGTHFHDGADKYIASLAKMLSYPRGDLSNHGKIRTVLDVGCGVASFGAYLLPLDILTMSVAPNDVHENQIQFALERGIPSTLGVLGTMRLPFPSKSFDFAHCSRCRIDWLQREGILLLEVDRLLRPGGYFAWSSPPAYRDDAEDVQIWNDMSDLVERMCWSVASKEGQTVIWTKPVTNVCYKKRPQGTHPPLCSEEDDPDAAWNAPMKACISPLSEYNDRIQGSGLPPWPRQLISAPQRLQDISVSDKHFQIDKMAWRSRVDFYWKQLNSEIDKSTFRNVMDMKAHFGGFAAALKDKPVWVMNVVPHSGPNTLKVIYDRGLIGSFHDWCEGFSTYPRTFDLLHAWTIFTDVDNLGCSMEDLLLEMDRILRPMGVVIIRDKSSVVEQVRKFLTALHWDAWSKVVKAETDGISTDDEKILFARKQLLKTDDGVL